MNLLKLIQYIVLGILGLLSLVSLLMGGKLAAMMNTYQVPDQTGKVHLITGGNSGIGYTSVLELLDKGGTVVFTARSEKKCKDTTERLMKDLGGRVPESRIKYLVMELADFSSVRRAAKDLIASGIKLDSLMLNAGIMKSVTGGTNFGYEITKDGFESHIQVNHLSQALFTELVLDKVMKKDGESRVVVVSSLAYMSAPKDGFLYEKSWTEGNFDNYMDMEAYGESKLANIVYARSIQRRYPNLVATSLHPGIVMTSLSKHYVEAWEKENEGESYIDSFEANFFYYLLATTKEGAFTQLYTATAPVSELHNGGFYIPPGVDTRDFFAHSAARRNDEIEKRLVAETEKAVGGFKF